MLYVTRHLLISTERLEEKMRRLIFDDIAYDDQPPAPAPVNPAPEGTESPRSS